MADAPRPWTPPEQPIPAHPAVGSIRNVPAKWRGAFMYDAHLTPYPNPKPGDFLAETELRGQTYARYVSFDPVRPRGARKRVYLVPLGELEGAPPASDLRAFVARYFQLEVELLPPLAIESLRARLRIGADTGEQQYSSYAIFRALAKRLPDDAYALVGLTNVDLYSYCREFVFGRAHTQRRVAVCSFYRYLRCIRAEHAGYEASLVARAHGIVAHELAHLFGLWHCMHFRCVMNGTAAKWESDHRPVRLCPVCLRKLFWAVQFDPVCRYEALRDYYAAAGLRDEAAWIDERLPQVDQRR